MNFVKNHFDLLFAISLAIVFTAVVWATSLPLGESIMLAVGVAAIWMLVFSVREDNELNR